MKQYLASNIRNVAIAGHGGSGKTSLAEALLYKTGSTDRLGKVTDGNTVCDFDPEEIKRKVSLSSTLAPLIWKDVKINLVDTPGFFDFEGGMYEGVRASDSVLIVISAKSGLSVGAEKAYKLASRLDRGKIIFVNKMDAEHADFPKTLDSIRGGLKGVSICPVVVPVVQEGNRARVYVNLLENKAYQYDAKGNAKEVSIPDGADLDEYRAILNEAVAETDEQLLEKFLMEEPFTKEEMVSGIQNGVKNRSLMPVLCGAAMSMEGIDMLLDAIKEHLPSPLDMGEITATDKSGSSVSLRYAQEGPLVAYIFKTVADPFVGKLSYFKVVRGKISSDVTPVNARTGEQERFGKLLFTTGKKQEDTSYVAAGDIGAVTKLSGVVTGDTLCDPKNIVLIPPLAFPEPCLSMAIRIKNKGDEGKVAQNMARLMEEDPTISFAQNNETRQQIISGLGEQHLDVIVSKLKSKFGVDIGLEPARVAYRETIRKPIKVQGKHKKQSGGHGQYGDVWIEFSPSEGEGLVFEENVFGGSVPKNFFPAVEKGLQDCVKKGVLAGYPMVGLKAVLVDGSYHPVDSSEMAFKMAASIAYKNAMPKASPALLEPIGNLKVWVPENYTGDILSEVNKRRGRVLGMNPDDKEETLTVIEGEVPMSEMGDFAVMLRSTTQGRGAFKLVFARYELLPNQLEAAVIEEAKKLHEES